MLNFITDYKLKFWVYKEFVIYIFCEFSHKSHTMHLMNYMIMSQRVNAFSCIHTFFYLYIDIDIVGAFLHLSFSLSLSLSLALVCSMAPKCESTPFQNLLCSRAFTSFNFTPSHVQFHDDKAWKDFSENFSRRGIHSECQVILSDFFDIGLLTVTNSQGWESLCGIPITCPSMVI